VPLASGLVDRWHSERLLQHLPDDQPLRALLEAVRVLRPGGRLVVVDTDWGTLSIASRAINIERRLARMLAARFASGYMGRILPRLVRQAGFLRTHVECFSVMLTPDTLDFVLRPTEQMALASRMLTPLEQQQWRIDIDDFRSSGDAFATVTVTLVAGQRL
jgi:SAM-dependent methyltransferase